MVVRRQAVMISPAAAAASAFVPSQACGEVGEAAPPGLGSPACGSMVRSGRRWSGGGGVVVATAAKGAESSSSSAGSSAGGGCVGAAAVLLVVKHGERVAVLIGPSATGADAIPVNASLVLRKLARGF